MGCTVKDKSSKNSRKTKSNFGSLAKASEISIEESNIDSSKDLDVVDSEDCMLKGCNESEGCEWGICTEQQLEALLLQNLEFLYNQAINKTMSFGYSEDAVMKAVLRNGHCYGNGDVLSNIINNSLMYFCRIEGGDESDFVFEDLKQLLDYSLAGMIGWLQQVRPQLSKGDAMWCLLMSDLNIGRASLLEVPSLNFGMDGDVCTCSQGGNCEQSGGDGSSLFKPLPSNIVHGGEISKTCKGNPGLIFRQEGPHTEGCTGECSVPNLDMHCAFADVSPNMSALPSEKLSVMKKSVAAMLSSRGLDVPSSSSGLGYAPNSATTRDGKSEFPALFTECPTLLKTKADVLCGIDEVNPVAEETVGCDLPQVDALVSQNSVKQSDDVEDSNNGDLVNSILGNLESMALEEKADGPVDRRDEMILKLTHQVKMLEVQLRERIEWAHQKAIQAANKLSKDLTELKILRMERDETLQQKKSRQNLDDSTLKKVSEMEAALRKASSQMDRANAAVKRLEVENAEIRAEMVASKLSAAESLKTCLEVEKREKKYLKKLVAWEKHKNKFHEEIAEEKQKGNKVQEEIQAIKELQKEMEMKWKDEVKAKESAITQAEEARRAREAAEANVKQRDEALRRKIEMDVQRHKDDIQRLEEELSRLKASSGSTCRNTTNMSCMGAGDMAKKQGEKKMTHEMNRNQESSRTEESKGNRQCLICMEEMVSVVFLPCTHQVLCSRCSKDHERKAKKNCPYCNALVERRIRVFGASSS